MAKKRNARRVEVIPSAKRLVSSLRDVGYDFPQAVADLVDNSVAAGASEVHIEVRFAGPDSWVRIADNGEGMVGSAITEAMRYGANRDYDDDDLGKFGLGLKTASLSQCRVLTVASRTDPERNRIEVRQLDLDHVTSSDRWEVLDLGPEDREDVENVIVPLEKGPGTVVLWQKLDRVLKYKHAHGNFAKNGINNAAARLELHLGMVFHRYLAGEVRRRRKLLITVNANKVEPWDPFARSEKNTVDFGEQEIEVHTEHGRGVVTYHPFILPAKEKFSDEAEFNRLSGPNKWNQQQGFYIYRAGRMIQSGGWCGLRAADEHTKYARAAIEFYPDLDPAFEVNVAKVRVNLPPELREALKEPTEKLCVAAKKAYSKAAERAASGDSSKVETGSQGGHGAKHSGKAGGTGRNGTSASSGCSGPSGEVTTTISLRDALAEAAERAGESEAFGKISRQFKKLHPDMSQDHGW